MKRYFLIGLVSFLAIRAESKDFGVLGATYPIHEENIVDYIRRKLGMMQQEGTLDEMMKKMQEQGSHRVMHPLAVASVQTTIHPRRFWFDPTITVPRDIRDPDGKLIHPQGKKLNPLHQFPFHETWFFIDGEDETQLKWVLEKIKNYPRYKTKVILTKGSPIRLMDQHKRRFYFDQHGVYTKKLGIQQVPSMIEAHGDQIYVEEIKVVPTSRGGVDEIRAPLD